ncbi:hypothetical protein BDF22DRAFT_669988 [Syncephalis plumigaleata]|nr:hypothetical protein BDF22DRAFT_669988 [Syncephalis plumigaleata]
MSDYVRMVVNVLPEFTRYALLHGFAEYCIVPLLDQKRVQALSIGDRIDLPEKLSSTVHALRISIRGMQLMFTNNPFQKDLYRGMDTRMSRLMHECLGYSLYDMLVMGMKPHEDRLMWFHHTLTSVGPAIYIIFQRGIYFGLPLTITELTVPVVNVLWVASRITDLSPRTRQILLGLRALVYIVARLFTAPIAVWMLAIEYGRTGMLIPKWSDLRCFWHFYRQLPKPCAIMIFVLLSGATVLNVIWTRMAVLSFIHNLRKRRRNK